MIHPTAIIHATAQLHPSVKVGPYAVIDGPVVIGANCRLGPHVHLTGSTTIGDKNDFDTGCVIGAAPQDLKYKGEPTRLRIGAENVFREHVTVHRSNKESEETVIGDHNFLMAHSHVGHNARLGDHVILANGALLGGHVLVHDRAFISGNCLVHQLVRVGTLALMQGGAAISQDLPPYCVARGVNSICGLNTIGLRRAGFTSEQRLELRRVYHALFRSGRKLGDAVVTAQAQFKGEPARVLIEFVADGRRGICRDTGRDEVAEESAEE